MITVEQMVRVTRKGGTVTHLALTNGVPSLCGRVALFGEKVPADRLCKTCARIAKVADRAGDWTDAEKAFITLPREAGMWEMLSDVIADYEGGAENDARRIALYRAALAHRNYATTVITNHSDARMPSGNGNTMGYGKAKPVNEASEKQIAFIRSMYITTDEAFGQNMSEIFAEELAKGIDKKRASALIEKLLPKFNEAKKILAEKRMAERKAESNTAPAQDGYYVRGESFVCVKWNRAKTGQYATVWNGSEWEYDGRESRAIVAEVKANKLAPMTPEDAKRFGDLYGVCFKCSRTLTDPESIAQGYGPVCAGRMGW